MTCYGTGGTRIGQGLNLGCREGAVVDSYVVEEAVEMRAGKCMLADLQICRVGDIACECPACPLNAVKVQSPRGAVKRAADQVPIAVTYGACAKVRGQPVASGPEG